ncbi:MAG: YgeY family selenium metabolism-linked hydrolase, partial [Chloroflexi bacterium]|nr:YgeY family selenium metabolism-linked hydrolase [Chloroflexota bacterium]
MPTPLTLFTQKLVRQRSLSGEEGAVIALIEAEMHTIGFDRVWRDENGSVIGEVHGALPGATILLDAHCDTVEANPADWAHDPFGGKILNGRLYGRGAADMKGALAAMLYAAAGLDRSRLAGKVAVSATVNEEVIEGVSLIPALHALQPDLVIIGEASELNLNRGGRGRAEIILETIGRSAHSSSPQFGLCAVHEMLRLIQQVEREPFLSHPLMGPASMVLTDILSTPYPGHSVLPYRCKVTYDRRLLPGETPQSVLADVARRLAGAGLDYRAGLTQGEEHTYTGAIQRGEKFFPAWELPEDHPYVQAALSGLRAAGLNPQIGAFHFCTNAAYSAGVAGVPTLGFGPCREGDAHIVDEAIDL